MVKVTEDDAKGLSRPPACDLIMKGGITSGVVYPAAVLELKEHFQFCSIGGASAGAIAAAATAAAQFGHKQAADRGHVGHDPGGFERLRKLSRNLQEDGFLLNLFQPTPRTAFLFGLLADLQRQKGLTKKLSHALGHLLWRFRIAVTAAALGGFVLLAWLVSSFGGGDERRWWGWVLLGTLVVLAGLLGVVVALIVSTVRVITRHLPASYYGICTGMPQPKRTSQALIPWLYEEIQACAGKSQNKPLTFRELKSAEVTLQMMTTDLTYARPVRLPVADDPKYLFNLEEFAVLFPPPVVEHLRLTTEVVPPADPAGPRPHPELRQLPDLDLPVIVATRMSLSFPGLLSAVPLWTDDKEHGPMRHWLSDGGIGSNFPIHFFDAWLPTRPTFGLNLLPVEAELVRPDPAGHPLHRRRTEIQSTMTFARQLLDTMQNWRDTMQAELPGFSDRIGTIELEPGQGGLNLGMDSKTIEKLAQKGHEEGKRLVDNFRWDRHLFWRYVYLMRLLQENLNGSAPPDGGGKIGVAYAFAAFEEALKAGMPSVKENREDYSQAWCAAAAYATRCLLDLTAPWGKTVPTEHEPTSDAQRPADFLSGTAPKPDHVMRVTPDI